MEIDIPAPEIREGLMTTALPGKAESLVELAKHDLAEKLDINSDEIERVLFEEVTWRDGSLGCPQSGRAYPQVLVNGTRIILRAVGRDWHYHSGAGRAPFLCMMPQEPLSAKDNPSSGSGDR
ncbi:hypothetical protein [Nitrosococcus wardiae]|uniref:Uncharacterized protein n=1 Tax=Nitrosococcus wardiae TaxID=1814290 RepID=A0A4P7BY56_9GAMM|nr:hypothetical protein [Nitrosococcus wardiae]QBQ54981.1 hypothetical protein E3U44_10990 [Nitrosococcus wardiae]